MHLVHSAKGVCIWYIPQRGGHEIGTFHKGAGMGDAPQTGRGSYEFGTCHKGAAMKLVCFTKGE